MLKHNSYFDGKVSVRHDCHGRRATVGVIAAGEFHFGTEAAERMSIVAGEVWAKLPASLSFALSRRGPPSRCPARAAST